MQALMVDLSQGMAAARCRHLPPVAAVALHQRADGFVAARDCGADQRRSAGLLVQGDQHNGGFQGPRVFKSAIRPP